MRLLNYLRLATVVIFVLLLAVLGASANWADKSERSEPTEPAAHSPSDPDKRWGVAVERKKHKRPPHKPVSEGRNWAKPKFPGPPLDLLKR